MDEEPYGCRSEKRSDDQERDDDDPKAIVGDGRAQLSKHWGGRRGSEHGNEPTAINSDVGDN